MTSHNLAKMMIVEHSRAYFFSSGMHCAPSMTIERTEHKETVAQNNYVIDNGQKAE